MDTNFPESARRGMTMVNVGPGERVASVAGGVAMLAAAALWRSKARWPLALMGAYEVFRGTTGYCVTYGLMGIKRARDDGRDAGIQIDRAVTINRPRAEVYRFWRNLENLPRFMQHVESVRFTADQRSHWVVEGPLGRPVEWDAEIVEDVKNERIAWASIPGSTVKNSGRVEFRDAPGGRGTEVQVSMIYNPPGGSAGAAAAKLFGRDAATEIREDMRRFKQIMEAGEAPTNDGQPSGRDLEGGDVNAPLARHRDAVQVASEESFPASDPPAWTGSRD